MPESTRRSAWAWSLAVAVAALLIYHPVVGYPFVWTDHAEIEDGRLVPRSLAELGRFLVLPKGAAKEARDGPRQAGAPGAGLTYHRPMKALSYGLDHALGSGRASSFHATNLGLHVLACLALFFLARRLLGPGREALAGCLALWQAVSPLHVETVCWVSARSDSLMACCGLLASLALLRGRAARPWLWRALAALLACLGAWSKESGLLIFPWLLVLSWGLPDPARPDGLRRWVSEAALVVAAGLAVVGLRLVAVGDLSPAAFARAGLGPWTLLDLFGDNLGLSFAPLELRLADSVPLLSGPSLRGLLGPLAWLAWLALGLRLGRRAPALLLGALGWVLFIAPVSQVVPLLHARGERYLYLPAMFAGLSLAWALGQGLTRLPGRAVRAGLLVAGLTCLLALGLWARARTLDWSDERRLFAQAVQDEPACAECWNNLAYARAVAGDLEGAAEAGRRALGVDRSRTRTYLDGYSTRFILARASLLLGQGGRVVGVLEELWLRAGPTPVVLGMLAEAYLQAGRPAHAVWLLDETWPAGLARWPHLARLLEAAVRAELDSGLSSLGRPPGCYPPVF
jgi:tetratricopeptide (TPR) repeat protein